MGFLGMLSFFIALVLAFFLAASLFRSVLNVRTTFRNGSTKKDLQSIVRRIKQLEACGGQDRFKEMITALSELAYKVNKF